MAITKSAALMHKHCSGLATLQLIAQHPLQVRRTVHFTQVRRHIKVHNICRCLNHFPTFHALCAQAVVPTLHNYTVHPVYRFTLRSSSAIAALKMY